MLVHLQLPVCVFLHWCAVVTKNMVLSDENIGVFYLAHSYFFSQQEKKTMYHEIKKIIFLTYMLG